MTEKEQKALEEDWYKPNTNNDYCMCGCGRLTEKAPRTSKRDGYKAGFHKRYCVGHIGKRFEEKRFCPQNHDTEKFGRTEGRHCRECRRLRSLKENISKEQWIAKRKRDRIYYQKMMNDQILRMKDNTRRRILANQKKLKEGYSGNWL